MKTLKQIVVISLASGLGIFYSSCQKESADENMQSSTSVAERRPVQVFYGPAVRIGMGEAQTWISEDENGNPMAVGVNLSDRVLDKLPADPRDYVLTFPHHGATDFYKHLLINWNPNGHDPLAIYGVPHFDFHFYNISSNDRMMIGPNDSVQFANAPAAQYVPPMYLQGPGGVPMMGSHWVDLLSPEFSGSPFTKTFIWGSYDGEFIFWEPMITRDYLLSLPDDNIALRQPQAFQHDGWYPQNYTITHSTTPGRYTISLSNLAYHQGQ